MQGRRAAMVRDGAAMVQFLYWLDTHIGKEDISELDIAEKLREFRSKQALYKGESFGTIAGYREHGAIVHYSASPESNSLLKPEGSYSSTRGPNMSTDDRHHPHRRSGGTHRRRNTRLHTRIERSYKYRYLHFPARHARRSNRYSRPA